MAQVPTLVSYHKGDLLQSKAQTLVNTVNCVGVMGKGIALSFKKQYPAMFADYHTDVIGMRSRLAFLSLSS